MLQKVFKLNNFFAHSKRFFGIHFYEFLYISAEQIKNKILFAHNLTAI